MAKKILAIDDNPSLLILIQANITHRIPGCTVITAKSGEEGVALAKKELPEVILLDIVMPGMNGFEVCQELKNDNLTKNIPILLVSALGHDTENRIKGLELGAEAFITKPFDNAELISQVRVLMRIKSAEDKLRAQNKNLEISIRNQFIEFNMYQSRISQISEYAQSFFWEIDNEGRYTYVSEVVEQILGIDYTQILHVRRLFDFPENGVDLTKKNTTLDIFNKKKHFTDFEFQCTSKSGKDKWLMLSGFPIYDDNGMFAGYRGMTQDITKRKHADKILQDSLIKINKYQRELKIVNSKLILSEEKERRRIAGYLHDGIGQLLSIAHINLSSLAGKNLPVDIYKIIQDSSDYINEAINQSRSLTYDLSPPILYELGLVAAIRWKLDSISSKHGIKTMLNCTIKQLNLTNDTRILIYRIISELLLNAIKHANASRIDVTITKDKIFHHFSVSDDGNGFEKSSGGKKRGYGLFSIHEKIDSMKGTINITSSPKIGTTVHIKIPQKQK